MSIQKDHTRRKFITNLTLSTATIMATPYLSKANNFFKKDVTYTVGQVMDMFIKTVPNAPFPNTVDTLKTGNRDTVVTSIITAMFPTVDVIKKAISLGANFIICHEPTFYNHTDDVSWLQNDEVYKDKTYLINKHNIAIWRNHDYIHSLVKDGVTIGVVTQLGWKDYQQSANTFILPSTPLKDLISHAKQKLNIEMVRYIGDLSQSCTSILLMPGAAGGRAQIQLIGKIKPDVLVCGEISEWETAEYVRDARAEGRQLALVALGHIASEEAGSEFMLKWIKEHLPQMKSAHIPSGNSLAFA
jgi:putative NIF3 family GTP cyclohydrolase 1 type 2